MVKKNPREINGFYLLGKINYEERKYKDAEKSLEKIIQLSKRVQIEESVLEETKAYLILCSYLRGDRKKTQKIVTESIGMFSPEKVRSLPLDMQDRERLQRIIKTYFAQSEAERKKIRIKYLENAIKKQPRNAGFYYELYDLYNEEKNLKASKKVIQKLLKNNPNDMNGRFLQGKIEFLQNRYKDAQRRFNRILQASDKSDTNRELILKSIIYISICSHHLNKKEDVRKFIKLLYDSVAEEEILRMVMDEGLEVEWERIVREMSG